MSRGAVTATSMKNMMTELSSRLATKGNSGHPPSFSRRSSMDDLPGLGQHHGFKNQDNEVLAADANGAQLHAEGARESSASASMVVLVPLRHTAEGSGVQDAQHDASDAPARPKAPSAAWGGKHTGSPAATMKDMMVELAAKAKSRESGSTLGLSSSSTAGPRRSDEGSNLAKPTTLKIEMDSVDDETVGARADTLAIPSLDTVEGPTPMGDTRLPGSAPSPDISNLNQSLSTQGESRYMKVRIAELAATHKAREERSALESATPPPPPPPPPRALPYLHQDSGVQAGKRNGRSAAVGGGGMKELMAELKARAKAREDRSTATLVSPALPMDGKQAERTPTDENFEGNEVVGGGGMKSLMAKPTARAKASAERSPTEFPTPPALSMQREQAERARLQKKSTAAAAAGGGSMKSLMAELTIKAKARDEQSVAQLAKAPPPPTAEEQEKDEGPAAAAAGGRNSMKDLMTELAAKAKAREKQPAVALNPSPLPLAQQQNHAKGTPTEENAGGGAPAGGGGMKGLMAELIVNAKARAQKYGAAVSE